jgi:hypothetical protein
LKGSYREFRFYCLHQKLVDNANRPLTIIMYILTSKQFGYDPN